MAQQVDHAQSVVRSGTASETARRCAPPAFARLTTAFARRRKSNIASVEVGKIRAFAVRHDPGRANLESLDNLTSADVYFGRVLDRYQTTRQILRTKAQQSGQMEMQDALTKIG